MLTVLYESMTSPSHHLFNRLFVYRSHVCITMHKLTELKSLLFLGISGMETPAPDSRRCMTIYLQT